MKPGFGVCGSIPYDLEIVDVDAWHPITGTMRAGPCPGRSFSALTIEDQPIVDT